MGFFPLFRRNFNNRFYSKTKIKQSLYLRQSHDFFSVIWFGSSSRRTYERVAAAADSCSESAFRPCIRTAAASCSID